MKNHINSVICRNLVKMRSRWRYSQENIAEALHITQPAYSKMESGRTRISADHLSVLATYYRVPVYIFFSDELNDRPTVY